MGSCSNREDIAQEKVGKKAEKVIEKNERGISKLTTVVQQHQDHNQTLRKQINQLFDTYDANKDGLISEEEMGSLLAFIARKHQKSKDYSKRQMKAIFTLIDSDHDQQVSKKQFYQFYTQHKTQV